MEPLGSQEGPAAYVQRTGYGADRAWKVWNDWMLAHGHPGMPRKQFRLLAHQGPNREGVKP